MPEGENATEYTWLAGPVRLATRDGWAGSATFHIQTLPSVTPTASVRPSGLNAAAQTYPAGPVSGAPTAVARAGSLTFHRWTVPSWLPTASRPPLGEKARPIA